MTARKPVRLKVLSGTVQKCRLPNKSDIDFEPISDIPEPPDWLPIDGVKEFNRLAEILHNQRLLTDASITTLAILCGVYAKIVQQFKAGTTPTASQVTQYRLLCIEFGLTPVASGKVRASQDDEKKKNKFSQNGQRPREVR